MWWKKLEWVGLNFIVLWLTAANAFGQGLLVVDQSSGTLDEIVTVATRLPDNQIAQSFTPLIPAVGFVQLQTSIFAISSGETLVVNLRQGSYNGPVVSSTDPVFLMNKITQINAFYFPENVPVTPNQLYFFEPVLLSAGSLDAGYKASSIYDRGEPWVNGGPSGPGDFWFREGIVVPEPATVWFLLFGSAVFIWRCRIERDSPR